MNTRTAQLSVTSTIRIRSYAKENLMNRRMLTVILTSLLFAFAVLNVAPVFAQEPAPGTVDAADQAYLQEYHQRAVEKYQSMQATQAARTAASVAATAPDWGGEMAVQEYNQRSRAAYAAVQQRSRPAVVNATPDWGGEMFLAEYEQRGRERYQVWLAQRNSRLTGSTSR